MITKIEKIDENHLNEKAIRDAGKIILAGGLVAFPTETVYGLGANALDARASKKIYAAKGRPSDNPLIVHICCMEDLAEIVTDVPDEAKMLANAFWPGPLTLILHKSEKVPLETTGGLDTVAIRFPANRIALALIREGGGYIAAPSANTSGRPSPTLAEHVYQDMKGKIPLILDGGAVGIGIESTILDLTEQTPTVLRPGAITVEMLSEVIGKAWVDPGIYAGETVPAQKGFPHFAGDAADMETGRRPKAPGMKYRHYAPKADLILVKGTSAGVVAKINELAQEDLSAGKKVGIIGTKETVDSYKKGVILNIGERQEEETIAHNLYRILREFDESDVDIIYSECFLTPHMGDAVMNRLLKAAGHRVIEVNRGE